jgi:hypothetical protein
MEPTTRTKYLTSKTGTSDNPVLEEGVYKSSGNTMSSNKKNTIRRDEECESADCDRSPEGVVKVDDNSLFLCKTHFRRAKIEHGPQMTESWLLPTEVAG